MEWQNCIAIGISLTTLLFTLWVYFKHDHEIKTLEKEKLEREALENKRAHFDVQYDWLFVNHILCLQNNGKSTAKNIVIDIESNGSITFQDGTTQYRIDQLEVTEKAKPIALLGGYQHSIKVKLTWDDESGNGVTQKAFFEDKGGNEFMRN
jgi:hypothetical protein